MVSVTELSLCCARHPQLMPGGCWLRATQLLSGFLASLGSVLLTGRPGQTVPQNPPGPGAARLPLTRVSHNARPQAQLLLFCPCNLIMLFCVTLLIQQIFIEFFASCQVLGIKGQTRKTASWPSWSRGWGWQERNQ